MRSLLIIVAVLVTGAIASEEQDRTKRHVCTPNSKWMQDCNQCWCDPYGFKWMCTAMNCHPEPVQPTSQCIPGTSFIVGCNRCYCTETGRTVCTPIPCPWNVGETCVPGTTFLHEDGCNQCSCPDSGLRKLARCTLKLCSTNPRTARSTHTCIPGEIFNYRCDADTSFSSQCRCDMNGQISVCTYELCEPEGLYN